MVGLIASAIAFHRIEEFSRRKLIPLFFPEGRLIELEGAIRISISRRIRLMNRVGNTIPLIILVVTLLTLQWEVEISTVSVRNYARDTLIFTLILFAYAFISSGLLNRLVSRNITQPLEEMIRVLRHVRRGEFNEKVGVVSNDEIGYTGDVINEMTGGLREREDLLRSLALAKEVQQNLLPRQNPDIQGLDIAAASLYCDETGGDYYDFLQTGQAVNGNVRIVLGDVSGHGISSALLMATTRAFLRQRSDMKGSLAQVVSDVNRQLCRDVMESGNFITLFFLEVDLSGKRLRWVRAGHDPGFCYNPRSDCFRELKGEGIALGMDEKWQYAEKEITGLSAGNIVFLFTDGIWEAQNQSGQMFGKEALCAVIQKKARLSAQQICDAVIQALSDFQAGARQEDDVTLIIVKIGDFKNQKDQQN
jgi:sigma-B regulation protein RsbU (phosphoserine phosphatase)